MPNFISEDRIEKAAVALLHDQYGYRSCWYGRACKGTKWGRTGMVIKQVSLPGAGWRKWRGAGRADNRPLRFLSQNLT